MSKLYAPSPELHRFMVWSEAAGCDHVFFSTQDEARVAAKRLLKAIPNQVVHVARIIATSEKPS